jgi:flagellar basal-body rod protein FlgB
MFAARRIVIRRQIKPAMWHAACLRTGAMLDNVAVHLERYMDLLSARQKLVASNIANADTPGYRTRDINFQSEFQNALDTTTAHADEVPGLKVKNDGNNVSLDREARLLAENALRFNLASALLRSEIRTVRSAIDAGKNG